MTDVADAPTRTFDLTSGSSPGVVAAAGGEPAKRVTFHDALREALQRREPRPPITLAIPTLASVHGGARFDPNFTIDQLEQWRQWSRDEKGGIDAVVLACTVLVRTCTAVTIDGIERDTDGAPVTFQSPTLWADLHVQDAVAAVKALYGNDFHVTATSDKILGASGWGEDIPSLDPSAP